MCEWSSRTIENISVRHRSYIPDVLCHFTIDGYSYSLQNRLADPADPESPWVPVAVTHRYLHSSCPFCQKEGRTQFICPTLSKKERMVSLDEYLKNHHHTRLQWLFLS